MLGDVVLIVLGLVALFFGGEWLVQGDSRIAQRLRISSLIIGLTVVAVGTSMPEFMVSVQAALTGLNDISFGNIVGSNIANIGLILGLCGLIFPIRVAVSLVRREIPIMILVSLVAVIMTLDGELGRVDGLILMVGFVLFTGYIYVAARDEQQAVAQVQRPAAEVEAEERALAAIRTPIELGRIAVGIVLLVIGAQLLVDGATNIARALQIPELVIGLTLVAVGTSLPEMATSIIATFRRENDIAVGNIVGSNIANLLLIMGLTIFIRPIVLTTDPIAQPLPVLELVAMVGFAVLLLPFTWNGRLGRRESALFLGAYLAFVIYNFAV